MNQGNQPIQAAGTYLYQLDDERKGNLWGGCLSPQNQNEPEHLAKAIKLMLAAEALLTTLQDVRGAIAWFKKTSAWHHTDDLMLAKIDAAIAKATAP